MNKIVQQFIHKDLQILISQNVETYRLKQNRR